MTQTFTREFNCTKNENLKWHSGLPVIGFNFLFLSLFLSTWRFEAASVEDNASSALLKLANLSTTSSSFLSFSLFLLWLCRQNTFGFFSGLGRKKNSAVVRFRFSNQPFLVKMDFVTMSDLMVIRDNIIFFLLTKSVSTLNWRSMSASPCGIMTATFVRLHRKANSSFTSNDVF